MNFTTPKTTIKFTPEQPNGYAVKMASTGKSQQKQQKQQAILTHPFNTVFSSFCRKEALCAPVGAQAAKPESSHSEIIK